MNSDRNCEMAAAASTLRVQRMHKISRWFHTLDVLGGASPALTCMEFNDRVLEMCEALGLELTVPEHVFRTAMCRVICCMYATRWCGMNLVPLAPPFPSEWSKSTRNEWLEYLQHRYFSADTWQHVWQTIPVALWEQDLSNWREAIQQCALEYIKASTTHLLDAGILTKDDVGNTVFVAIEESDVTEAD